MKVIKMSIRKLVEFIYRSGNIDNRVVSSPNALVRMQKRALEGIKAHQALQNEYNESDMAEVLLRHEFEYMGNLVTLEGRADGVLELRDEVLEEGNENKDNKDNNDNNDNDNENDKDKDNRNGSLNKKYIIDEIKLTAVQLDKIEENHNYLHWAQAMSYGYIFAKENKLDEIYIQLTYCHIDNYELKQFRRRYSFLEISEFFNKLIDEYKVWLRIQSEWEIKRNLSIAEMSFPFGEYRPGQREFAVRAYKGIENGANCYVQAPTGIGKTVSALFPAIKAMGQGFTSKVFYLTAKTITRGIAENCLEILRVKNLKIKSVTLTAKEKICHMDEANCNPDYCPYAKGHFDRINDTIKEILSNESIFTRDYISEISKEYNVCPFELSLDLSLWSDIVICDYNYVFDPRVYLKRFFNGTKTDFTFIVDEAHNLIDRARSMYSATIEKSDILEIKKYFTGKPSNAIDKKLKKAIDKLNSLFIDQKKTMEGKVEVLKDIPDEFIKAVENLLERSIEYLEKERKSDRKSVTKNDSKSDSEYDTKVDTKKDSKNEFMEKFLALYFRLYTFISMLDFYDEKYVTVLKKYSNEVFIKLYCVDPSRVIQEKMKLSRSNIMMSATLIPINYYIKMFGFEEKDYVIDLTSPFRKENRAIILADRVNTTYLKREETSEKIADYIFECINAKNGNYMVFFPSYNYMEMVYSVFITKYPEKKAAIQEKNMSDEDKEVFLNAYEIIKNENSETSVGFCVLGGHFSEGIDLVADRLIGVIVVGVGMPQIGLDRDIIKDHFNDNGEDGFEYAYVFPGMTKVLQAAGRCIRTESDRGVLIFIDTRYGQYRYKKLFPREWVPNTSVKEPSELAKICKNFWE